MSAVLEQLPVRAVIDGAIYIPLALLAPSSTVMQTTRRKHFDDKKLAELADSIRKHGVLQPILARAKPDAKTGQALYEIVAGERRWRASTLAKVDAIPAIVREISDFDALELQVIENLQRDDLHPLEEAEGYQALMRKPDGVQGYASADELAARIGKSRSYVFGRLKLCALIDSAKKAFADGEINASVALLIARMPPSVQVDATKAIVAGWGGEPMGYRAARDHLERNHMLKLGSALFKITDETLHPTAGSCNACGKRTGANPDLFDDIKSGDVCTDALCFNEKRDLHQARLVEAAKAAGRDVITGAAAKKLMPYGKHDIHGYTPLDAIQHSVGTGNKTMAKLLGKDAPETVLIEDPGTKELVHVVKTDAAMRVLKDKGLIKTVPSSRVSTSDAQRKAEAKAKAENAWRLAVGARTVAAAADPKFDSDVVLRAWLVPEFGAAMYDRLEYDNAKRVCKLLGWDEKKLGRGFDNASAKKISEHFHALTGAQLEQAFVAMAIAGHIHVGSYGVSGKPERLLAFAGRFGIDATAVRAELSAGQKKTAVKKATPAKKSSTLVKKPAAKQPKTSTTVKYRDVATGSTWSGRGLQPAWIKAALKGGQTLADFETTKPTPAVEKAPVSTGLDSMLKKDRYVSPTQKKLAARKKAKPASDAAPISLKSGAQISAAAAWPFPTGAPS